MPNKIKDKDFYKAFFTMTFTLAFQNLIVYGVNLADSVMMGAYSETALSGVGICNNIQFLLMMAVTGTCNGMTVIASAKPKSLIPGRLLTTLVMIVRHVLIGNLRVVMRLLVRFSEKPMKRFTKSSMLLCKANPS